MPITSEQIRTKPFLTERKGGYNKDEVVAFLEEVAEQFEALQSKVGQAESASDPAVLQELEELRSRVASHEGLQEALEQAYADVERLRGEVAKAREEREALSQKLATSADPTAAIGDEVAMVLRAAKEAASELKERAERESAQLRSDAERDSAQLRSDAEQARSAAEATAARLRSDAEAQASDIIARARREADELLSREMARYDELVAAQGEVTRRLEDAESVLRSVRDRLGAPAPIDRGAFGGIGESSQPAPQYTEPEQAQHAEEPEQAHHEPEQAQQSASDWFDQSRAEQPHSDEPTSHETQEFAG